MRRRFKVTLTALILSVLVDSNSLQASEPKVSHEQWHIVGKASFSVLWFDIYDATLRTPSGQFESYTQPLTIHLSYKREISKDDLLEETDKQLERFERDEGLRAKWIKELSAIWPDIKKGDELVYQTDLNNVGHFIFNQTLIGCVEDPLFSKTFPKIWLSPEGEYPKLASRLRGGLKSGVNQ